MACNCGKPEGTCGCNKDCHASPAVLQINNPAEYATFHKVDVPIAFGDDTEYPPLNGKYKNVILHYEKNGAVYIYSSDGIPTKLTYEESIETLKKPYISLRRLGSYTYEITFDELPEYRPTNIVAGACSSFVKDGKLYRNFDWYYDEAPTFVVKAKGLTGIANGDKLVDGELDNDIALGQLPYRIVDGYNDNGIMMSTHVLYNDWGWNGAGNKTIQLQKLPYLILTRVKSIATINEDLGSLISNLAGLESEYLLQFVITDGVTTYALLPPQSATGAYELVDITSNPKLTNFRWVENETVERNAAYMQNRPTGVERWNEMTEDMSELRFTKAYESNARLSEFIGINGTTKASADSELQTIYETAHGMYANRSRNGQLWQTVHSVVYSKHGMEHLYTQENWDIDYIADVDSNADIVFGFDTVADMIIDTDLSEGQKVKCFGYSEINDGNGGEFIISTTGEIELNNGLFASRLNYYQENFYNISAVQERHYKTDCFFTSIPKTDEIGLPVKLFTAKQEYSTQSPIKYAQDNLTSFTVNGNATLYHDGAYVSPVIIHNGEVIDGIEFYDQSWVDDNILYVGFKDDGTIADYQAKTTTSQQMIADGCKEVFDVYYKLIENYRPVDLTNVTVDGGHSIVTNKHPRQMLCEMTDGSIMFVTTNGRTDRNQGLTSEECQNLLIEKGVKNAWNMDGGGSTSLIIKGEKINQNIDDGFTKDRNVTNTLNIKHPIINKNIAEAVVQSGKVKQNLNEQLARIIPYTKNVSGKNLNEVKGELIFGLGNAVENAPDSFARGYIVNIPNPVENTRENWNSQIYLQRDNYRIFERRQVNGEWKNWAQIYPATIASINYSDYVLQSTNVYETPTPHHVNDAWTGLTLNEDKTWSFPNAVGEARTITLSAEIRKSGSNNFFIKMNRNGSEIKTWSSSQSGRTTVSCTALITNIQPTDKFAIQLYGNAGDALVRFDVIVA